MIKRFVLVLCLIFIFYLPVLGAAYPQLITGPTNIVTSGIYLVANDIGSTGIEISVSNVRVDLNGYVVDSVTIDAGVDNILVKNGTVQGASTGISAQSATNIQLQDLNVYDAIVGINFNDVVGGSITNCEMSQNITGVELNQSAKIIIESCVARCNTNAGFCLLSSTTNCLKDCKALSTGDSNNQILNQTIFGFVSTNGSANIFERCIANSTQALSTTDSQSLVAGFALRGDESCTKIIECESANAQTNTNGVTVPYGILIEGTLDSLVQFTNQSGPTALTDPQSLQWSPDGKYVAVVDDGIDKIIIYQFDRDAEKLTEVTTQTGSTALVTPRSSEWSPDGRYVAVVDSDIDKIIIYEFDRTTETLTEVTTQTGVTALATPLSSEWSPDGRYVAVADFTFAKIIIYEFDRVAETLTEVTTQTGATTLANPRSSEWSPDGRYVAVADDGPNKIIIYEFDRGAGTLTEVITQTGPTVLSVPRSSEWSPDGKYVAVADSDIDKIIIYEFDRATETLTEVTTQTGPTVLNVPLSSDWSPDGKYVAVADSGIDKIIIYEFDRGTQALTEVITQTGPTVLNVPLSSEWSPDGAYLAVADLVINQVIIYSAINFPSKNVITNNSVYCNSGGSCPSGVGISGSSIQNLIIGNTAYSNPVPQSPNHPIVESNYYFVTNVFNPLFGQAPSDLQNISVPGCEPICLPTDIALLLKQIRAIVCAIELQIPDLVSGSGGCAATPITAANLPTTINTPGLYCLAEDYSGSPASSAITIAANYVSLDLNNHTLDVTDQTAIFANGYNNITIKNGTANATDVSFTFPSGISISNGENITIFNIKTNGENDGIFLSNVVNAVIEDCFITGNPNSISASGSSEGIIAEQCANIIINKTTVIDRFIGINFVLTYSSCISDCKVLESGKSNTLQALSIWGIGLTSGQSNIVERCIVNATQGLTVTGSSSVVAGIRLIGTESCSKIIDCEVANTQTDPDGVTVPYGILLEATLNNPITLTTSVDSFPQAISFIGKSDWSPDGKLIAIAGNAELVAVYKFDYLKNILVLADFDSIANHTIQTVKWYPGGNYLAIGTNDDSSSPPTDIGKIRVYSFDSTSEKLTLATEIDVSGHNINTVDWSPDGRYLAAGTSEDSVTPTGLIQIYQFDSVSNELNLLSNTGIVDSSLASVQWSPDGATLAAGTKDAVAPINSSVVNVYAFNGSDGSLALLDSEMLGTNNVVNSVDWSPDGKYLAVSVSQAGPNNDGFLEVFSFDKNNTGNELQFVVSDTIATSDVRSADWSPDGKYIVMGSQGFIGSLSLVRVYLFDRGALTLTIEANRSGAFPSSVFWAQWSPDGSLISAVGNDSNDNDLALYEALTFPSKNVITNNTVYCNSGGNCPSGVGISGSSIQNMIIGNTSYSNPIPQSANHPIVSSNYQFVTNVFNPLFGQAPTDLQNISLDGCAPICMPEDPILLLKQIQYALTVCAPISISASSLPTTIATAGVYCLSEDVSGTIASPAITIAADNVTIDLNDHVIDVSGAVPISSSGFDTITIKNGRIDGSSGLDGISISSAQNIELSNVAISNCLVGVNFTNVQDSAIENCSFTQNTTGLQLTSCGQITVNHCTASRNLNAGYDLIDTGTSCLQDCKAISTGQNNSAILNQTIFGFVSSNGYGNIFERCIANATQALSTTDSQSIVAGFALRGDEGCTKIIECESANATTSSNGVTVPYGILLEAQFDGLVSITAASPDSDGNQTVSSVSWSPDGKYLAVGTTSNDTKDDLYLYEFDQGSNSLIKLAGYSPDSDGNQVVLSVSWSPDGKYLAVGTYSNDTKDDLYLYEFDQGSKSLIKLAGYSPDSTIDQIVYSGSWSPDGKYLAVGITTGSSTNDDLYLYEFDRVSKSLIKLAGYKPDSDGELVVRSVLWSPDGKYLAVGIDSGVDTEDDLYLYEFDRGSKSLIKLAGYKPDTDGDQIVYSVSWSPDGKYLAVGIDSFDLNKDDLYLYEFDQVSKSLIKLAGYSPDPDDKNQEVFSVSWSPDGKYLAVGIDSGVDTEDDLYLYEFDQGSKSLIKLAGYSPDPDGDQDVRSVSWSPDGQYLAVGINSGAADTKDDLFIYQALTFPSKNVIINNTVYCNSGGNCPSGVGISGSSICNMIIQNTSYSNPIDPFMVSQNYIFVTNVFNQLFGNRPTDLQNVSLGGCEPICIPCDLCTLMLQSQAQIDAANSRLDVAIALTP